MTLQCPHSASTKISTQWSLFSPKNNQKTRIFLIISQEELTLNFDLQEKREGNIPFSYFPMTCFYVIICELWSLKVL